MSCVSSSTAGSLPSTVACQECCASFTQQAQTCSSHLETLATEIPIAVSCRQVLLACKQNHKDYMICLQMIMLQHPSSGAHTTLDTDRHHILCITPFAQNGYVPHGDISATTLLVSSNARPRLLPPGQHPPPASMVQESKQTCCCCSYCHDFNAQQAAAQPYTAAYRDNQCVMSIGDCLLVLLALWIIFFVAAVYLDNVWPNKHGVRRR